MPKTNFFKEDAEDIEEIKQEPEKKIEIKAKRKFELDDRILCRSVTVGGLSLVSNKTKEYYRWEAYGDECEVAYGDLLSLIRGKSSYIFGPLFIIEDDEMIEEFPELKKFYEDSFTIKDLQKILELDENSLRKTLPTLPQRALQTLKSVASTAVANGKLDSVKKIRVLDEFFGTDLNLLSSLFSE